LVVQFIGFSYSAAADPENGFMLSFVGFTIGVGFCEEFCKIMPVYMAVNGRDDMNWRGAMVWGLASGIGFGVAEGVIYSIDYYNGIATITS
jgi:RsiW-degrading membrane proteinase PrsW (M82 family)